MPPLAISNLVPRSDAAHPTRTPPLSIAMPVIASWSSFSAQNALSIAPIAGRGPAAWPRRCAVDRLSPTPAWSRFPPQSPDEQSAAKRENVSQVASLLLRRIAAEDGVRRVFAMIGIIRIQHAEKQYEALLHRMQRPATQMPHVDHARGIARTTLLPCHGRCGRRPHDGLGSYRSRTFGCITRSAPQHG